MRTFCILVGGLLGAAAFVWSLQFSSCDNGKRPPKITIADVIVVAGCQ